jgi:glycosyltransferase involved in cell wall biosynthesis
MSRPLRVMLLTSAQHWRGSGLSYAKLARGLAERGHRVDVVVASEAVASHFARLGIPAHHLELERTGMREVLALLAIARSAETEIVIVDKPRDLRLVAWMRLMRPLEIVIRYNRMGRQARSRFVDRWTARRAAAAVYQSAYIRDKARADLPSLAGLHTYVVPNGYDVPAMTSGIATREQWRAAHGVDASAFVVVSAGFAEADKRFDQSVETMRSLARRAVDATFVFCGDGPCRAGLEAAASAGGVRSLWLGMQSPVEAMGAIGAADVLLHPSPVEIFGNVLAEAMSLRTPIVAARGGGNMELLGHDDSAAVLVDDGCADSFASAIAELYSRPQRRRSLADAAHARLLAEFPLHRMIDRYDDMLHELLDAPADAQ